MNTKHLNQVTGHHKQIIEGLVLIYCSNGTDHNIQAAFNADTLQLHLHFTRECLQTLPSWRTARLKWLSKWVWTLLSLAGWNTFEAQNGQWKTLQHVVHRCKSGKDLPSWIEICILKKREPNWSNWTFWNTFTDRHKLGLIVRFWHDRF